MVSNLTQQEMETHLNMTADDRSLWSIYSDDPVMQRRLESVGAEVTGAAKDGIGKFYTLPANQVSFRQPPKPMSEERKAHLATQLQRVRKTPVATGAE